MVVIQTNKTKRINKFNQTDREKRVLEELLNKANKYLNKLDKVNWKRY